MDSEFPLSHEPSARRRRLRVAAYLVAGALLGVLGLWGFQKLWTIAGAMDPSKNRLEAQLMRRKSDAMHDLLDAMVAGRLDRVEAAAVRVEGHAETIDRYLSTDVYRKHGAEFIVAVREVRAAARRKDMEAAKKATLRLERTCLDCHQQLNKAIDPSEWQ